MHARLNGIENESFTIHFYIVIQYIKGNINSNMTI